MYYTVFILYKINTTCSLTQIPNYFKLWHHFYVIIASYVRKSTCIEQMKYFQMVNIEKQ